MEDQKLSSTLAWLEVVYQQEILWYFQDVVDASPAAADDDGRQDVDGYPGEVDTGMMWYQKVVDGESDGKLAVVEG